MRPPLHRDASGPSLTDKTPAALVATDACRLPHVHRLGTESSPRARRLSASLPLGAPASSRGRCCLASQPPLSRNTHEVKPCPTSVLLSLLSRRGDACLGCTACTCHWRLPRRPLPVPLRRLARPPVLSPRSAHL
jgi:hypothetical protein